MRRRTHIPCDLSAQTRNGITRRAGYIYINKIDQRFPPRRERIYRVRERQDIALTRRLQVKTTLVLFLSFHLFIKGVEARRDTAAKTAGESRNGEEDRTTGDGQKGEGKREKHGVDNKLRSAVNERRVCIKSLQIRRRESSVRDAKESDDEINVPKRERKRGGRGVKGRRQAG